MSSRSECLAGGFACIVVLAALTVTAPPAGAAGLVCGQTITQDTTLTSDLSCPSGDGLVVGANGVTIDLAGHRISGTPGSTDGNVGVGVSQYGDVTVRGGTITGFAMGVAPTTESVAGPHDRFVGLVVDARDYAIAAGPGALVAFDTTTSPGEAGIFASGDDDVIVDNTTPVINVSGDGDRIAHNTVRDLVFAGSSEDIVDNPVSGVIANFEVGALQNERIVANTAGSIQLHGVSSSWVFFNTVRRSGEPPCGSPAANPLCDGIDLREGVLLSTRERLPVTASVFPANRDLLIGNHVSGAEDDGIYLQGPFSYAFDNGLGGSGIVSGAGVHGTVLVSNIASSNVSDDGIFSADSGAIFFRNTADDNGSLGIDATVGTIDLGGNRASGNGDPAQCIGVVCAPS